MSGKEGEISATGGKAKSLLETFRTLDKTTKDTLADLGSTLLLSFAAMSIGREKCGVERLSSEHIVACLEGAGVAVSKTSISRSLARAGDRVSTQIGLDGENLYRLMTKGEREIAPHLGGGGLEVVRFDGSKPRTARMRLAEVLSDLGGTVRICDPYYGLRTLDTLDHIPQASKVRFLTARTNEASQKMQAALSDFKRERPSIELRITDKPAELHDRYVLAQDQLLLVGHGLKDIGSKESFMVKLDRELAPDLIEETRKAFDSRWARGAVL